MFQKKTLYNVVWELTLKCNARCMHCGSSAGEARVDQLSHDENLLICEQLAEAGCKEVNLIGGEVFLYPEWKTIITRLIELNVDVSIITNAIALTDDKIDFLKDVGLKTLGISVDGGIPDTHDHIRQVPGLFDKIFQKLQYIDKVGINTVAITTLSKTNISELPLLRKKLIDSPFKAWQLQLAAPIGRMQNDLFLDWFEYYIAGLFFAQSRITIPNEKLIIFCLHDFGYFSKVIPKHTLYSKWTGCPAGKGVLGIRSDGKVQGCLSIYQDRFTEGDLRKQSLSEIWASKKLCQWNKRLPRFLSLKGLCKKCEYGLVCLGGCSDIAYALTDGVGENPQCYHAIESHWKKAKPQNDFEKVFKSITQGKVNSDGMIILNSGEKLTSEFVDNLKITSYQRDLLKFLTGYLE